MIDPALLQLATLIVDTKASVNCISIKCLGRYYQQFMSLIAEAKAKGEVSNYRTIPSKAKETIESFEVTLCLPTREALKHIDEHIGHYQVTFVDFLYDFSTSSPEDKEQAYELLTQRLGCQLINELAWKEPDMTWGITDELCDMDIMLMGHESSECGLVLNIAVANLYLKPLGLARLADIANLDLMDWARSVIWLISPDKLKATEIYLKRKGLEVPSGGEYRKIFDRTIGSRPNMGQWLIMQKHYDTAFNNKSYLLFRCMQELNGRVKVVNDWPTR